MRFHFWNRLGTADVIHLPHSHSISRHSPTYTQKNSHEKRGKHLSFSLPDFVISVQQFLHCHTHKNIKYQASHYLWLTAFPKLFDQDQNYRNNFSDYTALSNAQMFIFKKLNSYLDKKDNILDNKDSAILISIMDTATTVVMQHSIIDISLDKKQLDAKKIEF